MDKKCSSSRKQVLLFVIFMAVVLTSVRDSECMRRSSKTRELLPPPLNSTESEAAIGEPTVGHQTSRISQELHSPLLPPSPQEEEVIARRLAAGKARRRSRDQVVSNSTARSVAAAGKSSSTGKSGQAKQSWLAVASAVAHSAAAETNTHHQVLGDDSKPTKYHYYPHNQHLYLLPECATQQVCSAVYLRLNYSQPLCACPNFHEPCSVSTRTDDRHTIPLVTGFQSQVLTLVKTCEPTQEVRECRAPKDWSILALQNSRTGKAHYLVICRCPAPGYLEGPIAHSQPAYARVPGIRVYGMTCVRSSTRTGRLMSNDVVEGDNDAGSSRGTNPTFPWHRLKALLHSAGLIS